MSFLLKDFIQMVSNEPFNYHSGLWLLLSHITLGQTCSKLQNESIEDSEADNHSEKIDADLCEGCQVSCRFFAFLPISSGTEWRRINTAWLLRQFQNGGLQSRFLQDEFCQDSGHFKRLNFGGWKTWIFTCYRRRQKKGSFLEWPCKESIFREVPSRSTATLRSYPSNALRIPTAIISRVISSPH